MKKISIGISDFALPTPRRGSIDAHSGFGRNQQQLGQEIHLDVQAKRIKQFSNYSAEVVLTHEIIHDEFVFELRGRMDGFFDGDRPKIEEIKSTFNIFDLLRSLKNSENDHPYCLQLKTYGYIYWIQNQKLPDLVMHLVSTRNSESYDFELKLDIKIFEVWLALRLEEISEEIRLEKKRIDRRRKVSKNLIFPFQKPRSGQIELIETIEQGMIDNRPMLLQAPTGLGKTVGVLYPTLKEALARGQKLIYITPKNSQHAVAEEAVNRLQEIGANIKSLTITAKSKMCFKNEPLCNPEYCEYAKDHYTKIAENKVIEQLSQKRSLTSRIIKKIAEENQVCPFELQLEAAGIVDAVICDYNYVFAPRAAFGRLTTEGYLQSGRPNLVIDEAHNLPSRAMDYYSPSLSVHTLERMKEDTLKLSSKFRRAVEKLIDSCVQVVKNCALTGEKNAHQIALSFYDFLEQDLELKNFLSTYLSSDVEIQSRDVVMRLCFYWSEFTATLALLKDENEGRFFTTFSPNPATVKITCCDASKMLKESYKEYAQVVGFSATLKPFDFYSRLTGLESKKLKTSEFTSPFPKANRKILVIPQISSKFSDREKNYPKIADAIERITALKRGNYVVFVPSFDFLERVLAQLHEAPSYVILKQERSMKRDEIEDVLNRLKDPGTAHILFAVQGGVFSEGVDYPGNMIIGAFVVGTPLPHFSLEREKMRAYYEKNYATGFDYTYTYPAMAKAVQSAGRVIRSETDQGIIILMDNRFMHPSYLKSMPQDWFDTDPHEMVSQSILKDISQFWEHAEKLKNIIAPYDNT